ncbi:MAG: tRNA (adenosine(37)-N6)-dimethylallyltransferase MiaA [Clostridia bacterium]|nr:tRNA (adenosine(37)-N6)-dimethylallyltransferase MiaA [Clostridia bacterium]
MNRVIVLVGPTAVGKTEYSLEIAKRYNGEIVSCDSMQLYKFMSIGSAKPTEEELGTVPHHLVDFFDPRDEFSVSIYSDMARKAIKDILSRGKTPVISGGTGLYLNSILYEMDFSNKDKDQDLRDELETLSNEELMERLTSIDSESAARIHINNRKKLIRAIEAEGLSDFSALDNRNPDISPVLIALTRDRDELYDRINRRVDLMVESGLFDEVKSLMELGLQVSDISMKGIGYKEVIDCINGNSTIEDAVDTIKKNTRHYAKRQITWFKRYSDMNWVNISEFSSKDDVLKHIFDIIDGFNG